VVGRRYRLTVSARLQTDRLELRADVLVAVFAGG
jgi:hypothetical protein